MKKTRETAVDILYAVFVEGAYANLLLNKSLRSIDDGREKAFLTNLVYGVIRRSVPVDFQLRKFLKKPFRRKDKYIESILRAAVFELIYTAAKPYAVVNEYVALGKRKGNEMWGKVINGVLRNFLRQAKDLSWPEFESEAQKKAFYASVPDWIVDLWQKERGEEDALRLIDSVDHEYSPVLRVNTLKTSHEAFTDELIDAGISFERGILCPDAFRLHKGADLTGLASDHFIVQEESSQLVAKILSPQPGTEVLDMCAAPGGKTTHLAQIMRNRGLIKACDIHEHKCGLIRENAKRLGITIIDTELRDGLSWKKDESSAFDYVLLDAPCSGLGVLARRADSRLRKKPGDVEALSELQFRLLESAYHVLRPGGKMVYSTCTLTYTENLENRNRFLARFPDMHSCAFDDISLGFTASERDSAAEGFLELMPYSHNTDGFFIACFEKDNP